MLRKNRISKRKKKLRRKKIKWKRRKWNAVSCNFIANSFYLDSCTLLLCVVCAIWFSFQLQQQKNEKKCVAISSLQIKIMTFLRLQFREKNHIEIVHSENIQNNISSLESQRNYSNQKHFLDRKKLKRTAKMSTNIRI